MPPPASSATARGLDLPSPPPLVRQNSSSTEAAERRLRKADETFKEAIEELQRHNHACWRDRLGGELEACCDHSDESCVAHAVGNLCQSFLLSYGVRVGIGILLRAFKLARRHSFSSILDLKQLVSEKNLIVREEACRIGLLFGGFTGSYHALRCFLRRIRKRETPLNAIVAGSVSGLSILALDDPSRRRTLALYLLARLAQPNPRISFIFGEVIGDMETLYYFLSRAPRLLFIPAYTVTMVLCLSGMLLLVMYAFVMRPESLPKAYQDFIQKTGPVAEPVYKAVRECCRGGRVDLISLSTYLSSKKGSTMFTLKHPSIIPCTVIHPESNSCLAHNAKAASETFRKTFPLYFSLTFVPFVVLRLQKFLESPAWTSWRAAQDAIRSTTFLSSFVGVFQGVICLHRKVASKDHKFIYWCAGAIAALSILLEKKARRAELALYVLPRAVDSLWYISVNRHFLPDIKNAEVALFCICMGGIMFFLEQEPDTMAPFLRGLIRRFLASRISNPTLSANKNSYSYLTNLGTIEKTESQMRKTNEEESGAAASAKYNLESIPGL